MEIEIISFGVLTQLLFNVLCATGRITGCPTLHYDTSTCLLQSPGISFTQSLTPHLGCSGEINVSPMLSWDSVHILLWTYHIEL